MIGRFFIISILLGVSSLLGPTTSLQAQSKSDVQKFKQMSKQLNLSRKQQSRLAPVLISEAAQVRTIQANTSLSRPQQLDQMRAVRIRNNPKLRTILTPEQFQQLRVMRKTEAERQ